METRGIENSPSWDAARLKMPLVYTAKLAPVACAGDGKNAKTASPAAGAGIILMVAEASKQNVCRGTQAGTGGRAVPGADRCVGSRFPVWHQALPEL